MTVPASEFRERLLKQGCEEDMADAIVALVEVAPSDGMAKVIMKAGERAACSEQLVIDRLNAQISRNREQSLAVNSVLDDIAYAIKVQPDQGIDWSDQDRSQMLQAVVETRAENSRRQQVENARLHAEVSAACDRWRAENDRRYAEDMAELAEQRAKRMAALAKQKAERMAALAD